MSKVFKKCNGKYFLSELVNWKVGEEQEADKSNHMRPQDGTCRQKQKETAVWAGQKGDEKKITTKFL